MSFPQQNPVNRPEKTESMAQNGASLRWLLADGTSLSGRGRNVYWGEPVVVVVGWCTPSAVTNVWEHSSATSQTLLSLGEQFKQVEGRRQKTQRNRANKHTNRDALKSSLT